MRDYRRARSLVFPRTGRSRMRAMSKRVALWMIGLSTLSPGCCYLGAMAARNICYEKTLKRDNRAEWNEDRSLAESALAEFQSAHPGQALSTDFADGFIDGFAGYVYAGDPGGPPPLPPRHYW